MLFVDVVASTGLASTLPPREVLALLNQLFAVVVDVVDAHGGWINKFIGDAAMAVFGAPEPLSDHAGAALATARTLALELASSVPELDFGVGVSTGTVVAGHLGDERRYEYTLIGDMVNVASRLTEVAKQQANRVCADQRAIDAASAQEGERWQATGPMVLRGRSRPVSVAVPRDGIGSSCAAPRGPPRHSGRAGSMTLDDRHVGR